MPHYLVIGDDGSDLRQHMDEQISEAEALGLVSKATDLNFTKDCAIALTLCDWMQDRIALLVEVLRLCGPDCEVNFRVDYKVYHRDLRFGQRSTIAVKLTPIVTPYRLEEIIRGLQSIEVRYHAILELRSFRRKREFHDFKVAVVSRTHKIVDHIRESAKALIEAERRFRVNGLHWRQRNKAWPFDWSDVSLDENSSGPKIRNALELTGFGDRFSELLVAAEAAVPSVEPPEDISPFVARREAVSGSSTEPFDSS